MRVSKILVGVDGPHIHTHCPLSTPPISAPTRMADRSCWEYDFTHFPFSMRLYLQRPAYPRAGRLHGCSCGLLHETFFPRSSVLSAPMPAPVDWLAHLPWWRTTFAACCLGTGDGSRALARTSSASSMLSLLVVQPLLPSPLSWLPAATVARETGLGLTAVHPMSTPQGGGSI